MKAKKVMFYCLAGLVAGCVPVLSLNPFFTEENIIFDEKLLGAWTGDANDPNLSLEFARVEENSAGDLPRELQGVFEPIYRMTLFDKRNGKGVLIACLVKLGDRRFLDVFPDRFPSGESDPEKMKLAFNASFFLRCHTLMRVDTIGDQLKVHLMDDEGFKKLVEAEPKGVAYAMTEEGPVLTASTKELQAFVTKYADDKRLFALEGTFVRKNK